MIPISCFSDHRWAPEVARPGVNAAKLIAFVTAENKLVCLSPLAPS
jgi:hypothetical protein